MPSCNGRRITKSPRHDAESRRLHSCPGTATRSSHTAGVQGVYLQPAKPTGIVFHCCFQCCRARAACIFPIIYKLSEPKEEQARLGTINSPPPRVFGSPSPLHDERIVGWVKYLTHELLAAGSDVRSFLISVTDNGSPNNTLLHRALPHIKCFAKAPAAWRCSPQCQGPCNRRSTARRPLRFRTFPWGNTGKQLLK
jgi:hypothetical protein